MVKEAKQPEGKTKGDQMGIMFKVEKMFILPDAGSLKAFADVSICDVVIVRGFRVLDGKKGLFVSAPHEQGKDNKFYDIFVCKDCETYDALSSAVLEHYNQQKTK